MQCPHCGYEERTWNRNIDDYVENKEGKFFTQNRVAERTDKFGDVSTRSVYGCPSCNLMFMSEYL